MATKKQEVEQLLEKHKPFFDCVLQRAKSSYVKGCDMRQLISDSIEEQMEFEASIAYGLDKKKEAAALAHVGESLYKELRAS